MKTIILLLTTLWFGSSCMANTQVTKTPYDTGRNIGLTYIITKDVNSSTGYKYVSLQKAEAFKAAYFCYSSYLDNPEPGDIKSLLVAELRNKFKKSPALVASADIIINDTWRSMSSRYKLENKDYLAQLKLLKEIHRGIKSAVDDYLYKLE